MLHQDGRSKRPMVVSLTSANAEFNHWLKENHFSQVPDASGQIWSVRADVQILPDPVNKHTAVHRLQFEIRTEFSKALLLDRGVLDRSKDQRLLQLMDDSRIAVLYQRAPFDCDSADKLKRQAADDFVKIKTSMRAVDLGGLYRAAVGRWVDRQFHMAFPMQSVPQIKIDLAI